MFAGDSDWLAVVGYQTRDIAGGVGQFTMMNVPFTHVSGTDGISLEELVFEGKYMDPDWTLSKCDQVWVWDPNKSGVGAYWCYYWDIGSDDPSDSWDAGWINVDSGDYFTDDFPNGLPEGATFYFKNAEAKPKSMTGSGAVESKDEVEIEIAKNNFTMVGNPYPVATDLEKVDFKGKYMDPDWTLSKCDQVWIWDPNKSGVGAYWCYYWDVGSDDPSDSWDAGWINVDSGDYFADDFENGIPSGWPFYYKSQADGGDKSATFSSPITK